jgi:hypothetical protein
VLGHLRQGHMEGQRGEQQQQAFKFAHQLH